MKHTYNTLKRISMFLATLFLITAASSLASVIPAEWRAPYIIGICAGGLFALWAVWVAQNW